MPRMEIAINRASPKVVETKLKKNQTIVVVFDVNVQGPTGCTAIFDDASMDLIGELKQTFPYSPNSNFS